jgi:hypothetical protein
MNLQLLFQCVLHVISNYTTAEYASILQHPKYASSSEFQYIYVSLKLGRSFEKKRKKKRAQFQRTNLCMLNLSFINEITIIFN